MRTLQTRMLTLATACALALASCTGDKGDTGPIGPTGPTGPTGPGGVSMGTINGKVQATSADGSIVYAGGVPDVTVRTEQDVGVAPATTDAAGNYALAGVPIGAHAILFERAGLATQRLSPVLVSAGQTTTLDAKMPYSAIALSIKGASAAIDIPSPAGFGQFVAMTAVATGATGPVTYTWSITAGPTAATVTPDAADASKASLTTGTLAEIVAGGKVNAPPLAFPSRAAFITVSPGQLARMSYTVKVTANDGQYQQTATATVAPATLTASAGEFAPTGVLAIGHDAAGSTFAWTLTDPGGGDVTASKLLFADTRNPMFVPDADGTWTLANGATASLALRAGSYVGLGRFIDTTATNTGKCSMCHSGDPGTNLALQNAQAKVKAWKNSQHGNRYGKYFEYDASGNLVPRAGVTGLPTDGGPDWPVSAGPMTTLQWGLSRGSGAHYSGRCMGCHSTGYVAASSGANGGFDDLMASLPWSAPTLADPVPSTPDLTAWTALPADLKALAGMQCEACHGPLGGHVANPAGVKPGRFFDAGACAFCHDRPSSHDRVLLWSQSKHANLALAEEEATVETRGTSAAHCGRCHASQGFSVWAKQLLAGNPGNILKPDGSAADVAYLQSLGLTAASVQPVTCQGCHDPHGTALRLDGSVPIPLPAGFTVAGGGAGQLCMACHNTRNGLRDDAHPPTSFSAPHVASQADVYMGMNAFFVGIGQGADYLSKHAAVKETCAGCHMAKEGADPTLFLPPRNTNHSMRVGEELCAGCHGAEVNGEATKARVELGLADVGAAGAQAMWNAVNPVLTGDGSYLVRAWDPATDLYSSAASSTSNVTLTQLPAASAIGWSEIHGQIGVRMTLATPIAVTWTDSSTTTVSDLYFQLGSLKTTANATIALANSNLVKGMWNYFLIHSDGSFGLHNPGFVLDTIAMTKFMIGQ